MLIFFFAIWKSVVLLLEVHSKFVFDPRVGVRTLLAGVEVALLPQLPRVELTHFGYVAGSLLQRDRLLGVKINWFYIYIHKL